MVPTTLASLAIFVVLLLPGYTFVRRRQRVHPSRERSAFSEIASVVFAGVVFDATVLALFLAAHKAFPAMPPDLDRLFADPGAYGRRHYYEIALWSVILILAATALANLSGTRLGRALVNAWSGSPSDVHQSAWWLLFDEQHPGKTKFVSCVLEDGSLIRGAVFSFSRASREHADREIVLSQPLSYRAGPRNDIEKLPDVAAVSVSSRRIVTLMVSYVVPEHVITAVVPPQTKPPASTEGSAKGGGQLDSPGAAAAG
jgi:hypothetical protein